MAETRKERGEDSAADSFVGRQRERDELHDLLRRASDGSGSLVLLSGEPGIGKTRLANILCDRASQQGFSVLWGRCWEESGTSAFWPWLQILQDCEAKLAPAVDLLGPIDAAPLEHVGLGSSRSANDTTAASDHTRFRFFDATTRLLQAASKRCPLIVILDDLHVADESSLQLLHFVARELGGSRILLLATYRSAGARHSQGLSRVLPNLARLGRHLHLPGLSVEEVARCIAAVSRQTPPIPLTNSVHRVTAGNPFFVEAIARALRVDAKDKVESNDLASFRIPDEVCDAIRRQLEPLGDDIHRVLEIAAVCGQEFEERVLQRVTGPATEMLTSALDRACREGVIQEKLGQPGRYTFSHSLVVETLYQGLPANKREALHLEIGTAMERIAGNESEATVAIRAHHFLAAGANGDIAKAVAYAEKAGQSAFRLYGYEEATRWFERALDAFDRWGGSEESRCRVLLSLAESVRWSGDMRRALALLTEVCERARAANLPDQFAAAAIAMPHCLPETGEVNQTLVDFLREAVELLPRRDSLLRAAALGRLADSLYFAPPSHEREQASEAAVAMARRLADPCGLILVLRTRHVALRRPGHAEERLAIADEMLPLAERVGDFEAAFEARYWRIGALLELGETDAAVGDLDSYLRQAKRRRYRNEEWEAALLSTATALLHGRFDAAEELATQALELGELYQIGNAAQFFAVQSFFLRREKDQLADLEVGVRRFIEEFPQLHIWRCGLAFLWAELGMHEEARSELSALAKNRLQAFSFDLNWLAALSFLADTCAEIGDATTAAVLFDHLKPFASTNIVVAMSVACRGSLAHFLGRLADTCGNYEEAARQYEAALEQNARMSAWPALAETQFQYARMLHRLSGQAARASSQRIPGPLAREALAIARRIGMPRLVRRIAESGIELSTDETTSPLSGQSLREPDLIPGSVAAMRRDGTMWTIEYADSVICLSHTKGLLYLARLLSSPDRPWHVTDLVASVQLPVDADPLQVSREAQRQLLARFADVLGDEGLPSRANSLPASETSADLVESILARPESPLCDPLVRLVESQRVAVSKAIAVAFAAIGSSHPELRRFLAATIHSGRYCRYTPNKENPVIWHCS